MNTSEYQCFYIDKDDDKKWHWRKKISYRQNEADNDEKLAIIADKMKTTMKIGSSG